MEQQKKTPLDLIQSTFIFSIPWNNKKISLDLMQSTFIFSIPWNSKKKKSYLDLMFEFISQARALQFVQQMSLILNTCLLDTQ